MEDISEADNRVRYTKAVSMLRKIAIKTGWKPNPNPFKVPTPTGEEPDKWWAGLSQEEQTAFLNQ